jgi:putative transcriptional regulator
MTIHHHPDGDFLLRYAAGEISEPMALVVASHLAFCRECRRAVTQAEALGGTLLESQPVESLSVSAAQHQIERTLARAARSPVPAERNRPANADPLLPQPLRDYVKSIGAVGWTSLGTGIHQHIVAKDRHGAVARLLKVAPGRAIFEHGHGGSELTLVLQGTYQAAGRHFSRGDVECADETTEHRPAAGADATCICLMASEAPLRFHNLLGRLMQPFLGI